MSINNKSEIDKKIDNFIKKYSYNIPEFTKELFKKDKNCKLENPINYSKTNIVLNYANKNQYIFNYIFNCTVNQTIFFLDQPIDFFKSRFENNNNGLYRETKIGLPFIKEELFKNDYYKKLCYIIFLYLATQRKIIQYLQNDQNEQKINIKKEKYGLISSVFYWELTKFNHKEYNEDSNWNI